MNMEQLIETLRSIQGDLNQAKEELQEVLYSEFVTQELNDEMDGLLEEIAQIDARIDYLRDLND